MLRGLKKPWKQALAGLMVALMVLGVIPVNPYSADGKVLRAKAEATTYTLMDVKLPASVTESTSDYGDKKGSSGYFTVNATSSKAISTEDKAKTFEDGTAITQVLKMGSGNQGSVDSRSIEFTVGTGCTAAVKVYGIASGGKAADGNYTVIGLYNSEKELVDSQNVTAGDTPVTEFTIKDAGTYYITDYKGSDATSAYKGLNVYGVSVVEAEKAAEVSSASYAIKDVNLPASVTASTSDYGDKKGDSGYFTVNATSSKAISTEDKAKTFEDGTAITQVLKMGSGNQGSVDSRSIEFTVGTGCTATVKVYGIASGGKAADGNYTVIGLYNSEKELVDSQNVTAGDTPVTEFTIKDAGTYYITDYKGSDATSAYKGLNLYGVIVTETSGEGGTSARKAWSTVETPVITEITQKDSKMTVSYNMVIGDDGADNVVVTMTSPSGDASNKKSTKQGESGSVEFEASSSGKYTFSIKASRDGEEDKAGVDTKSFDFVLPLTAPSVSSATSQGNGVVMVKWGAVTEAEQYRVDVEGTDISVKTAELQAAISGLTVGSKYTFKVYALRGTDVSEAGEIQATATGESQQEWAFRRFGNGVDKSNNGYSGSANDGAVTVYSKGGKGKVVPASTDGLAFYYTTIDPNTTNFTLTATANVNNWTYSNGQEGFGLMAADRVGTDLDATPFWNNSYMASVTKVEYYWDASKQAVSDSGTKISMKLGIGSQQKIGVTKDNLAKFDANDTATINDNFSSTMTTLETSCAYQGAGTYNVIGNATAAVPGTVGEPLTKVKLTIQKNNTGYFVSYTDADGNKTTKKYYDTEALNKIDSDHVYVGFFASRNADVTFTDISFTTISKEADAPKEETPITYVTPKYSFESSKNSNSRDYDLVYVGNADGQLVVTTEAGTELYNGSVTADQKLHISTILEYGKNIYYATMTPNADYCPSEYERLSSYEAVELTHTVTFEISNRNVVYVSPDGRSGGEGTKESPVDIYTAVKSPRAGQQIILMEGTYNLTSTVTVDRGINGTADEKIYMIADPEAKTRPVLDFNHACAGMVLAGNYWYFQGFDVTNSINGQKGIQVSGSNNVLDNLQTYRNGNTGIQISRYKSSDQKEDWPANNTILNCTSFLNADAGYEDADGFAAKLTIGEGNVFDGCVSAYNADDGWDLFAKVETGQIGKVVIKNSVAFKNGYVLDENGKQVNAGNGNGFKMGGDSITGYHSLENSIAFANKAKGIDSNSCPDIQVNMATSFDNQAYNVAFYTNNAANTDFAATGIISYGKQYKNGENLKPKGSQDTSKYGGDTNYYYADGAYKNASGKQVEDGWFESLDTDAFLAAGVVKHEDGVYTIGNLSRNDDGTINMNGYLVLTSAAPTDAGARLSGAGTASENVAIEDDVIYVAKTSETIPDSVLTDAVKSVTGCTTVDELIIYIQKKLLEDAKGDDLFSGITVEDTVVWDVEVMISEDGGKTFSKATEANFPKNGVDVYLPYPTGTNGGYAFVVRHLITMAVNGQTVGEIENCPVLETTGDGICVHVMSASPFAIAWAPIPEDDDYVETTDSGNKGSELPLINHTATRVVVTSTMGEAKNAAGITGSDYLQVEIDVLQNDNQAVKLMKAFAAQNNLTLSGYFDINVYRMTANGVKAARLTNLQSPINLMLETPEGLDAKQYDFGVIRVHDGVAELLKDTDNDPITISVASDKFSPYAVVYAPKGSLASVKAGIATSSISKSGSKASPKTADESKFVPEIPETEVADFTQKQVEKQLQQEVTDLLITPQATPFPFGIVIVALVAMVAFIGGEVIFFRKRNQK